MKQINVIPANPGWFVVYPVWDSGPGWKVHGVGYEPVVAWVVNISGNDDRYHSSAAPLTAEFSLDPLADAQVLKRPDGTFFAPGDRELNAEEECIAFFREQAEQDELRKAK